MITLAPEMCSQDIIKLFSDNGVIVAAGPAMLHILRQYPF